MQLLMKNNSFLYETENIIRIFYPLDKIHNVNEITETDYVITDVEKQGDSFIVGAVCNIGEKETRHSEECNEADFDEREKERLVALSVYYCLCEINGYIPPWGILTGVRPSKLMRMQKAVKGDIEAERFFREKMLVSEDKTRLAYEVAKAEDDIIALSSDRNSFSLYVSIPFCPTRCSYCSFVSHSVAQAKKLIPDYVNLLCEEIKQTGNIVKHLGLRLETVYFGGGTPTSLDAIYIKQITDAVKENFDIENAREYTIEAGRPDTLTKEKLEIMKNAGVTRISINPQTFEDKVLENIGRKHTSQMTVDAFNTARAIGFDNINMDFIAGLPGDTVETFTNSINKAVELNPENITVHTLALKRASTIVTHNNEDTVSRESVRMLENANDILRKHGYLPYYMYRQSKSVGNLENVGWAKEGYRCLYNVYMMEEVHSVFAVGGGAVTKLTYKNSDNVERIFNFKYPYEYISRFSEITERKKGICEFYSKKD